VRIADASIRRPVFAVMLVGALVVLGLVSIPRLGLDLYPRVEFPIVTVKAVLQGAAPETVEREVSQVLEESINTIEGIRSLRSVSSDSLSIVWVEFELEYDIQEKAQEVREKVAAARADLPRDLEAPVVDRVDPDAGAILAVMVAGPHSILRLSELADKRIKPRLERIPGVGSVTLVGARPREIRVWIDPLRLGGYELAVDDVLAALQREHVELPGGRIESAEREWAVKTEGKLASAEQFGAIVVAQRAGRVVHLRDVATVEDGMAEERTLSRLNGRRGVSLLVRRQSGENTVAVADALKVELQAIRRELPAGYEMIEALDTSRFIRSSIHDVTVDLAWGACLAAAIVLVFLRDARSTLITAIAIPSSLLASFTFFYAFGFTLNTLTLMALSLSIGILIDDAIVVLENIYRHRERGAPPLEAASSGTSEIGLAVVATTLALCAVFVPIAFLSGVVGRFFREFGLVATCAILASLLVALTLTPMLCSRLVRVGGEQGAVYRVLESGYQRLEAHYRRVLAFGLRHRLAVVGLAAAAVVGGIAVARTIPVDFLTVEDRSEFNVWLKLPLGSSVPQTQSLTARVEDEILRHPDVRAVFSTIGSGAQQRVNEALCYVQLVHKSEREASQVEIMAELRRRIAALELGLEDLAVEEVAWINVAGARSAQIMYAVRGPDIERLQGFVAGLTERMRAAGGYADLYSSYETGKPEVSLEITRERAADLGVPALQIGRTISALFAGIEATSFEEAGERYDVRVQLRPEYRDDPGKLDLVRVRASTGELVPLRNLVIPRVGTGPVQIERESRTRSITLYGNLDGLSAGAADEQVMGFARELGIAGEYEIEPVGPSERLRETVAAVGFAFVLALVAIYMILASQFNSFLHPFTIMLSAPLSFLGAFATLRVLGLSIDVMGQIAFLMLMGIVMKNGILLVDYTNTLRERGLPLFDAVLEAGPVRMRPVLMTATSTIFGMLPLALGRGDGSEWRSPMGMIAIGGLAASTLLTLLVVPVVYTLVDDAQSGVLRGWRALRGAAQRARAGTALLAALLLAAAPAQAEEALAVRMQRIFESVRAVLPLSVDPEELGAGRHRARVHPALQALARESGLLASHTRSRDPGFGYAAGFLANDAGEILRSYEAARFEEAAFLLRQTAESCVACHTRQASPGDFPRAEEFVTGTELARLPPAERALLQTATRRFDDALATYEALFAAPGVHPARVLGELTDYLVLGVRVKGDLARPVPVLRRFAARQDLWRHLRMDVERWIADLEALRGEDLAKPDLARARWLLDEARRRVGFPSDRAALVPYVVASTLLHRYAEVHAGEGGRDLAEAYYLLGLVESRIGRDTWVSPSASFLEAAVRTAPQEPFAEQAYALLEEAAILGWAADESLQLPPDVDRKLAELRALLDAR
jgi:HAE1 family hydrophobic/amphiphilic exporter-1